MVMTEQYFILKEIINIDDVIVEICKDGYGVYHAVAPFFNIFDYDANKKDIIDVATHTVNVWNRYTEEKGYE